MHDLHLEKIKRIINAKVNITSAENNDMHHKFTARTNLDHSINEIDVKHAS